MHVSEQMRNNGAEPSSCVRNPGLNMWLFAGVQRGRGSVSHAALAAKIRGAVARAASAAASLSDSNLSLSFFYITARR